MSQPQPSNRGDNTYIDRIITQCSDYNIRDTQGIFGNLGDNTYISREAEVRMRESFLGYICVEA